MPRRATRESRATDCDKIRFGDWFLDRLPVGQPASFNPHCHPRALVICARLVIAWTPTHKQTHTHSHIIHTNGTHNQTHPHSHTIHTNGIRAIFNQVTKTVLGSFECDSWTEARLSDFPSGRRAHKWVPFSLFTSDQQDQKERSLLGAVYSVVPGTTHTHTHASFPCLLVALSFDTFQGISITRHPQKAVSTFLPAPVTHDAVF